MRVVRENVTDRECAVRYTVSNYGLKIFKPKTRKIMLGIIFTINERKVNFDLIADLVEVESGNIDVIMFADEMNRMMNLIANKDRIKTVL
ncbi:MAG: hypothetical protein ACRC0G_12425 [Fusobacteriaceae bacterium]